LADPLLALLAEPLLTEALPALHSGVLQLRLVLQHSDDLRYDRQELPDHFVDILLTQLSRRLAKGRVADRPVRLLCLGQNLRQRRHQLPYHLIHILRRKLALLTAPLLPPLRLLLAPALMRLRAPSCAGSRGTECGLTAILAVLLLLTICRLSQSITA